eukprot:TRINITY_DN6636_c0_g2_i8.p1 TRINITY_DN6636_c0_g2~~TRINITY_DN6636_c0_g2_i8.p1  ORF type:complete len:199 (+),score=15.77 TRINITY_DN6636_c0_g2_i8:133-729(+)
MHMIPFSSSAEITFDEEKSECDSLSALIKKAKRQTKQSYVMCHKLVNSLLPINPITPFSDFENDSEMSSTASSFNKRIKIPATRHILTFNPPLAPRNSRKLKSKPAPLKKSHTKLAVLLIFTLALLTLTASICLTLRSLVRASVYVDIESMNNVEYYRAGASKYKNYALEQKTGIEVAKEARRERKRIFKMTYHVQSN